MKINKKDKSAEKLLRFFLSLSSFFCVFLHRKYQRNNYD